MAVGSVVKSVYIVLGIAVGGAIGVVYRKYMIYKYRVT